MNTPTDNEQSLEHGHRPDEIRERLAAPYHHSYLRDFVYGAIDGTVTTFAVVSGVAGADLDASIVIILGTANLVGDGFSMAAGNFLGTRTEQQVLERTQQMEEHHIDRNPDGEREEIRQIFAGKGFSGSDLERVVEVITADRQLWVQTMLTDEHSLSLGRAQPMKAAVVTFVAFLLAGLLPLLPFIAFYFDAFSGTPYLPSALLTGVAFFLIGTMKSRFVDQHWGWAGLETLGVGGAAAFLAYVIGILLKGIAI